MTIRLSLLAILFFASCKPSLPEGVLPPERMEAVYWDLMQADELSGEYATIDTGFNRLHKSDSLYAIVFQVHGITRDAFRQSQSYYASHPKLLKNVLDSLNAKGERLKLADTPKRKLVNIDTAIRQRKPVMDSSRGRLE